MRSRKGNIYFSGLWPYLPNTICLLNSLFSLQDCIKEKNKLKGFKHYLFFKTICAYYRFRKWSPSHSWLKPSRSPPSDSLPTGPHVPPRPSHMWTGPYITTHFSAICGVLHPTLIIWQHPLGAANTSGPIQSPLSF